MKRLLTACLFLVLMFTGLSGNIMFSEAHAQRAEAFFSNLKHVKSPFHGKPFVLLPWERQIIRDVYGTLKEDGTRQYKTVYIEIPKKNGKTELIAGAALYHLFADGEQYGEIYGCASDRSQAALAYDVAVGMIEQSPTLLKRAKITDSKREITDKVSKSFYRVESSEAYTKHGLNVSCCLFDELHAQPNRDLWDVMTSGSGDARLQPIWWIITTAGDDPDRVSIGWEEHEYAMQVLAEPQYDPTWYVVVYNYDGDDIYNENNWYKANPSLGHTIQIDSFREFAQKARNKPADERNFRWLKLNQWITTKVTSWLPLDLWDQSIGKWNRSDLLGKTCYIGQDLSSTIDLTSICLVFPPQGTQLDWRVIWDTFIPNTNMIDRIKTDKVPYDQWEKDGWITATEGNVIDYMAVKKRILTWKTICDVKELDTDIHFATMLCQELQAEGMETVDIPQTYASMTNPMNEIERLLGLGQITHENNLVARWAFGNASISQNGSGFKKLVKETRGRGIIRTKRIDPIVAWVNAMSRAVLFQGPVDISEQILRDDWGM